MKPEPAVKRWPAFLILVGLGIVGLAIGLWIAWVAWQELLADWAFMTLLAMIAVGLALATTGLVTKSVEVTGWPATSMYSLVVVLVVYDAFMAGVLRFEQVNCGGNPSFDGDCDLGVIDGVMWAAFAFVGAIFALAVLEVLVQRIAIRSGSRRTMTDARAHTTSSARLTAYGVAGAVWTGGYVIGPVLNLEAIAVVLAVATYVLVGTLVVGLSGERIPHVLAALWLVSVLLVVSLQMTGSLDGWAFLFLGSLLYATLGFVAWVATAGAIVAFLHNGQRVRVD